MRNSVLAGAAFLIAAGLTVWGTFSEIVSWEVASLDPTSGQDLRSRETSFTWWELDNNNSATGSPPYRPFGIIPALGAGLIMIAALFATQQQLRTGARIIAGVGLGIIAGATGIRFMDTLDYLAVEPLANNRSSVVIGLGIWLPAGAVVVGLAGVVLMSLRNKTETPSPLPETLTPYPR